MHRYVRLRLVILCALALNGIFSVRAEAYIPETSYIFTQAVKHQGKATYVINQDVVFKRNFDSVTVHEKWIVQDGFNSELTVMSPSVQYEANYDMSGRWTWTDRGHEHLALPADFTEGFFNARNVAQFYRLMQSRQILNADQIAGPPRSAADKKEFRYIPNPAIRLTRAQGKPSWTFGVMGADVNSKAPMLWVQQDAFTVQQVRTQSGAEVQAGEYGHFTHGLDFPKTRHYVWGGNDVIAQITRIDVATADQARAALNHGGASSGKSAGKSLQVKSGPLSDMIQEFYTRFR